MAWLQRDLHHLTWTESQDLQPLPRRRRGGFPEFILRELQRTKSRAPLRRQGGRIGRHPRCQGPTHHVRQRAHGQPLQQPARRRTAMSDFHILRLPLLLRHRLVRLRCRVESKTLPKWEATMWGHSSHCEVARLLTTRRFGRRSLAPATLTASRVMIGSKSSSVVASNFTGASARDLRSACRLLGSAEGATGQPRNVFQLAQQLAQQFVQRLHGTPCRPVLAQIPSSRYEHMTICRTFPISSRLGSSSTARLFDHSPSAA